MTLVSVMTTAFRSQQACTGEAEVFLPDVMQRTHIEEGSESIEQWWGPGNQQCKRQYVQPSRHCYLILLYSKLSPSKILIKGAR